MNSFCEFEKLRRQKEMLISTLGNVENAIRKCYSIGQAEGKSYTGGFVLHNFIELVTFEHCVTTSLTAVAPTGPEYHTFGGGGNIYI